MENFTDPMRTAPTTVPTITVERRDTQQSGDSTTPPTSTGKKTPGSPRTPRHNLKKTRPRPSTQPLNPASIQIKKCRVDIRRDLPETHTSSSRIGLALQESFRRRFGVWWRNKYDNPDTRRALKAELKKHLAEEISHATFNSVTPPLEAKQTSNQCECYLHKYFHADVQLTFPDCYLQYHHQDQDVPRTS